MAAPTPPASIAAAWWSTSSRSTAAPCRATRARNSPRAAPSARADVRAGDLVFFSTVAPGASHVGIALDDDEFVHAPSSNGVVRVERLTTTYWRTRFVGARRLD